MGFASGTVSYRRLFQTGKAVADLSDDVLAAIAEHVFGKHGSVTSDGIETGWIVPNHLFDIDFSDPERILFDRFLFLAMRMDRTAVPSAIVQSYRKMEEDAAREAGGNEFLGRTDRRLAKEAAAARAEKEARAGMFRRIAAHPVLIDLRAGTVFFGNLGPTAGDKLMSLFSDTFGNSLVPATAEESAFRLSERKGWQQAFEDSKPTYFVPPPASFDTNGGSGTGMQDRSYLGREFLLWLWSRCDTQEGVFEFSDHGAITVAMEKLLDLSCGFDLTGMAMLRTEVPATSPEARAALRIGKLPTKAGLFINTGRADWSLTLDGENLSVTALSITKCEDEDRRDILLDRFGQIADVASLIEDLFSEFINHRLGKCWPDESDGLRRWASNGKHESPDRRAMRLATA